MWFWLYTCVLSHLASAIRSHSLWKTANLGSRRIASGNWLQARRTSSDICPNIMELETDELGLIGLRITLRGYSLWNYIQKLWLSYFNWFSFYNILYLPELLQLQWGICPEPVLRNTRGVCRSVSSSLISFCRDITTVYLKSLVIVLYCL